MIGWEEGEVSPKNINYWARVIGARGGVSEGKMREYGREDSELYYQERVAVIWIEKFKAMGSCALYCVERGRGSAEERVILVDMSNVGMFERVSKAVSNLPIIVISSDVRTLGNRN